ncbi:MAG TPA: methyltransferase domain-containing protein [Nocardioidaceae bacterium]
MSIASQVRLFVRRRLRFPVPDDALVLDVGSGDKPSWRADVLLDRYVDESYAGQRSGTSRARVSRPLFDADAADMPFRDDAFAYTICSNLLEHVPDPAAVLEELMRVSSAGYIEVPEAASAKIVDFPSHVWWCRLDTTERPPTLVFSAKSDRHFDPEIGAYLDRTGLDRRVARVLDSRFEDRVLMIDWRDKISYRIEGRVPDDFMTHALEQPGHGRTLSATAILAATRALTLPRRRRARHRIRFDDIVKDEFRKGTDELLTRRIYRVDSA